MDEGGGGFTDPGERGAVDFRQAASTAGLRGLEFVAPPIRGEVHSAYFTNLALPACGHILTPLYYRFDFVSPLHDPPHRPPAAGRL